MMPDRPDQGVRGKKKLSSGQFRPRTEHEAARRHRQRRASDPPLHHSRPGQRLHRRAGIVRVSADGRAADRRPGLRRRLVPRSLDRQGYPTLHPGKKDPRQGRAIRQALIQATQPHRDHVWSSEGLAPHRHPLRQMPQGLPVSHRIGRRGHLLAMTINESGA